VTLVETVWADPGERVEDGTEWNEPPGQFGTEVPM
jgi:hypothetical protein